MTTTQTVYNPASAIPPVPARLQAGQAGIPIVPQPFISAAVMDKLLQEAYPEGRFSSYWFKTRDSNAAVTLSSGNIIPLGLLNSNADKDVSLSAYTAAALYNTFDTTPDKQTLSNDLLITGMRLLLDTDLATLTQPLIGVLLHGSVVNMKRDGKPLTGNINLAQLPMVRSVVTIPGQITLAASATYGVAYQPCALDEFCMFHKPILVQNGDAWSAYIRSVSSSTNHDVQTIINTNLTGTNYMKIGFEFTGLRLPAGAFVRAGIPMGR